jgi:membrane protease YdiL (CAAX protease family)
METPLFCGRYRSNYSTLILFRNLAFAPFVEEVVFRSLMFSILFVANCAPIEDVRHEQHALIFAAKECSWPKVQLLLCICPFMFSVAHLHHFFERIKQGRSVASAASDVAVQGTYTGIFGYIAVVLFARTGNFVAPVLCHVICNFVGLPELGFMVRPQDPSTSPYPKQVPEYAFLHPYRHLLLVLHGFGLMLFAIFLFPLTADLAH